MKMLEYYKMILEKVHFEPSIFKKELNKALKRSTLKENKNLLAWCRKKFKNDRLT